MQALFSEDETMIGEAIERLTRGGRARARSALDGAAPPTGPDGSLMSDWIGLGIPETLGGSGGTLVGAALLMQALGRSLEPGRFCTEFLSRHVLAAAGIPVSDAGGRPLAVELARPIELVNGEASGSLAAVQGATAGGAVVTLGPQGKLLLAEVRALAPTVGVDPLRPCARVTVGGAPLAHRPAAGRALEVGAALVAAELCGVGRGALELAVDYAKERVQFGRPIGSYQAIAHRLAQCSADIEAAWSLVLYACWAAEAGAADAEHAARAAKAQAGEAALATAEACIQTHGGMGITHAADPHLYLRRALSSDAWFGTAALHRRELGRLVIARP